jgi:hypothetical protein
MARLIRFGEPGNEKPDLLDDNERRLDCSSLVEDWSMKTFRAGALEAIGGWDLTSLPEVSAETRWAAPVARPQAIRAARGEPLRCPVNQPVAKT